MRIIHSLRQIHFYEVLNGCVGLILGAMLFTLPILETLFKQTNLALRKHCM